jgi:hypothetical protein
MPKTKIEAGRINPIKTIKNTYNKTKSFVISGSQQFTSKVRNILNKCGNNIITSLTICRIPINSMIQRVLELASWKTIPYEQLFHLSLIINNNVLLEKNSVINMQINPNMPSDTEQMASPIPSNTTIHQFISNCQTHMGNNFFSYSASDNNCQNFILNLLQSNHISDANLFNFIKQDTQSIFENNYVRKLTNNVTDIDGRITELSGGQLKKLQKHCILHLTKDELKSLIDENGNLKYIFHPDNNRLICDLLNKR